MGERPFGRLPAGLALAASLAGASTLAAAPPAPRHLVERAVDAAGLERVLLSREAFRPYPPSPDRAGWETLVPEATRRAFVAAAEKELDTPWATLPATRFLDFVRDGNRGRYEALLFSRRAKLGRLVLGETLEGKGRFADAIADGVWLLCEESFWGVPAHVGMQKRGAGLPDVGEPIVDLFAAETGALLAWTDFLVGDRLDAVHPMVRERLRAEVERHRGRAVKSTGDGLLAVFDGPARAIRCGLAAHEAVADLGVRLRVGLHTGECEVLGDDVGGVAVHIGARVTKAAEPGEVLVSGTVRDLVVGSRISFEQRGERELKGVPGTWALYAVAE